MDRVERFLGFLSRPVTVVILLIVYLVFLLIIFPMLGQNTPAAPPIDLAFHYSVKEVYGWIECYGEAGRQAYILGELTVDLVYPLVYTCLFAGLIGFLTRFREGGQYRWLALSPVSIWLFDLFENMGIVTMLYYYPVQLHGLAMITSWLTTIKWTLACSVITLTLGLAIRFVMGKFHRPAT